MDLGGNLDYMKMIRLSIWVSIEYFLISKFFYKKYSIEMINNIEYFQCVSMV
ncbi:hypothetical protein CHRY9293_01455 [Chryseobacterium potabilaquae]|uniref:Uncharacterized protein n=1 Tax=Chryseobacterium potabilaquae TaxID=2675057 RepID=A0A6N4X720_9FLAO|nr:hypothetical protein CHRY9293_01455 [Chryseobacterium potabilaquae]